MKFLLGDITMKFTPVYDKDFLPISVVLADYKKAVKNSANKTLKICVGRNDKYNYIYELQIFADQSKQEEHYKIAERIIKSILDKENPMDIDRMLIATYTNAAVDELRERIGKAIKKAVTENPEDTRLEEQLLKLKDAKILTITACCNSILRSCAESIGLPPNYRIAEPAEAKILSSRTLEALINSAYEGEIPDVCTPEEFIAVADCISNVKHSEGLADAISFIFEKLTYSERGIETLTTLIEEYNPEKFESVEKTGMGAYIIGELKRNIRHFRNHRGRPLPLPLHRLFNGGRLRLGRRRKLFNFGFRNLLQIILIHNR